MNSVFGPPSTSSPLISWAGGDDGGGRGSKRKIEYDGSFNLANTMSDEKYRQLKEEASSSSSSDSEDDEDDNFHYGFEQIKLLPEPARMLYAHPKNHVPILMKHQSCSNLLMQKSVIVQYAYHSIPK